MTTRRQRLIERRKSQGFSQESLAERLAVDTRTVGRWESGVNDPQPWLRPKLAQLLQVSLEQLDGLLVDERPDDDAEDRLEHVLRHPDSVDAVTVEDLRGRVRGLMRDYDRSPSTSLLARAGQYLGHVEFLGAHTGDTGLRRELWSAEAEAATFMGQLVWDASQRRDVETAKDYFDRAISAARQLGDPVAEGQALLRKSYVVLYGEKNPRLGRLITQQTTEATANASHVLTGLGLLHNAEAKAMLSRGRDCEKTLAAAERSFDRIESTDPALAMFSPTQHGRLAGSCFLFLGNPKRAQPILESTAKGIRDRSKSQAIVLGNLSLSYLRQRKLEEAVASMHRAIDIVELTRGGGGLNIVFDTCRELQPFRDLSFVHDVYDRVFTLMATT